MSEPPRTERELRELIASCHTPRAAALLAAGWVAHVAQEVARDDLALVLLERHPDPDPAHHELEAQALDARADRLRAYLIELEGTLPPKLGAAAREVHELLRAAARDERGRAGLP